MSETQKPAKRTTKKEKASELFSDSERAAMKEHAEELRAAKRRGGADDEKGVLAKIAEMSEPDRSIAERVHALVKEAAPHLTSRTWYGMPAYAKDGKVVCFFKSAAKYESRYCEFGFNDPAALDDGTMWPTAYAITEMNATNEAAITTLVKKAAG